MFKNLGLRFAKCGLSEEEHDNRINKQAWRYACRMSSG